MRVIIQTKLILILLLFATNLLAEPFTVITKTNAIRELPRFFAKVKANVRYGDIVDTLNKEGDWFKVKFNNITGFIHKSAIEKRKIDTKATFNQEYTTSEGEITLAGKGFNPQVESAFKNKYPMMRYDLVDKVEKYNVSDQDLLSFIRSGGLVEPR
jgi:hypothetical protein